MTHPIISDGGHWGNISILGKGNGKSKNKASCSFGNHRRISLHNGRLKSVIGNFFSRLYCSPLAGYLQRFIGRRFRFCRGRTVAPSPMGHFTGRSHRCFSRFCPRSINCVLYVRQVRGTPEHSGNGFPDNCLGRNISFCEENQEERVRVLRIWDWQGTNLTARRTY